MDYFKLKRFLISTMISIVFSSGSNGQNVDSMRIAIDKILKVKENPALKTNVNSIHYHDDTTRLNHFLSLAHKYRNSGKDSLFYFSQKALQLSLKLNDLDRISRSVEALGGYYIGKEDFTNAGECYLLSLKIEERTGNKKRIADINHLLGTIYFWQEIFGKSLSYLSAALEEYERENDTLNIAKVYTHLGNLYNSREYCEQRTTEQKREDFNKAISYFEKSIRLSIQIVHEPMEINGYANIAVVYDKLDRPEKALAYITKAVEYFRKIKDMESLMNTLHTLGVTYYKSGQYFLSIKSYEEALKIGRENNSLDGVHFLYESMAQSFAAAKDYKNANEYYIKYMTIKDSISNMQKLKELNELETKYQSEKKGFEITKLITQRQEKNLLLFALSGLMVILCVLGYFILKNIRNQKLIAEQTIEIKEQHIQELEKERQLIATKSVLKGEESERSRMARDLHDGLGGLLSGVKINLSSMKGNAIISKENSDIFDHSIKLLDNSIIELRRVAHSLMPETLNLFGLNTALNDFITELSTGKTPLLTFRFFGKDVRYDAQLELTLYRIAQELVNNALKHSGARNIDLQLLGETSRVCIQVVDNGKGFDITSRSGHGKGLISIRDRVASTNGRFDLESTPGQGTEATVEFILLSS